MTVGKLTRVPLREVWKHEAHDFTRWLQENIDVINDILDFKIFSPEREKSAGSFSADILAEDENGDPVVIENQLEKSDHEHLGKLITYVSILEAKRGVWIVAEPRNEHIQAISWLNESSGAAFYLLKLEGVQIGESERAPLFTLITGPSEESISIGEKKKELAGRHLLRFRFWKGFLGMVEGKTKLYNNISPSKDSWITGSTGKSGLNFNITLRQHDAQVELWIGRGKEKAEENLQIFEALKKEQESIENVFGEPLEWQRLDGKMGCRIRKIIDLAGYSDESEWENLYEALADGISRLEKAILPHIPKLKM